MQQKAQEHLGSQVSTNSRSSVTASHRPLTAVQRDRTGTTAAQFRSGRPASAAPAFVRRENVAVKEQVEDEGEQDEEEGGAGVVQQASSALSLFDRSEGGAPGAQQVRADEGLAGLKITALKLRSISVSRCPSHTSLVTLALMCRPLITRLRLPLQLQHRQLLQCHHPPPP